MQKGLEFDDVLIVPVPSTVNSRDEVDISIRLSSRIDLKFPLLASPMTGVTNGKFLSKLSDLGGMGFVHRFYETPSDRWNDILNNLAINDTYGVAIGLNDEFEEIVDGINPPAIMVDIANGYLSSLLKYVEQLKNHIVSQGLDIIVFAGNVVTYDGARNLMNAGADVIRGGIGGGHNCSTRNITGISVPTITALQNMANVPVRIMQDGGVRNSGDFVKSIIAGADICMSGKLFAQCFEAPNEGVLWGMASRKHMENQGYRIKSVEGFETIIDKQYSLEQFVREFSYGICSAGTYLNANTLDEIRLNGEFIEVTNSAIKKGL